ncbi:hypothetical protein D3C76_696240 [compost metagenome]|jgi:hypothetical protein
MGVPLRWRVVTYSVCVIGCKAIFRPLVPLTKGVRAAMPTVSSTEKWLTRNVKRVPERRFTLALKQSAIDRVIQSKGP